MQSQLSKQSLYPNRVANKDLSALIEEKQLVKGQSPFLDKKGNIIASGLEIYSSYNADSTSYSIIMSSLADEGYIVGQEMINFFIDFHADGVIPYDYMNTAITKDYFKEANKILLNEYLSKILKESIVSDNLTDEDLVRVNLKIKTYHDSLGKNKTLKNELYLNLYFFIGELIKNKVNGTWKVILRPDFLYEPKIVNEDKEYNFMNWLKGFNQGQYNLDILAVVKSVISIQNDFDFHDK